MMTMMTTATQQVYSFIMLKIGNVVQSLSEVAFNFFVFSAFSWNNCKNKFRGRIYLAALQDGVSLFWKATGVHPHYVIFFFKFVSLNSNITSTNWVPQNQWNLVYKDFIPCCFSARTRGYTYATTKSSSTTNSISSTTG